jgi:hypothetical protein
MCVCVRARLKQKERVYSIALGPRPSRAWPSAARPRPLAHCCGAQVKPSGGKVALGAMARSPWPWPVPN